MFLYPFIIFSPFFPFVFFSFRSSSLLFFPFVSLLPFPPPPPTFYTLLFSLRRRFSFISVSFPMVSWNMKVGQAECQDRQEAMHMNKQNCKRGRQMVYFTPLLFYLVLSLH